MKAFKRAKPSYEDAFECLLPILNEFTDIIFNAKSYPIFSLNKMKKNLQPYFSSNNTISTIIAEFSVTPRK